jgi:asparagine synthase (glutamine-hydrolysing)
MCGIVGGFAFRVEGINSLSRINEANQCLSRRGPDGGHIFQDGRVALGHRRLSIIDTSSAADQPMFSRDKNQVIVFNGEIFNYRELKLKYFRDYQFDTTSDTEVFLELFNKLGTACFQELRGFFAAAIYDVQKEELVLVRDRYGKKPLLLYADEDKFLFASEMKALFTMGVPKAIRWDVLPTYFQLNYVPQPYSLIRDVSKLQPGSYLIVSKSGIEEKVYYHLQTRPENYEAHSYEQAKKNLVEILSEAVKIRLVSDVPLGAFLSGGIDSSVIVALASQHTDRLKTFSIGYKDNPYFDETAFANLVAKKYQTEHTVFSLTSDDFLEHIYDVLNYLDEPFADSSAIPEYILSYYTRKHVTVALSGDGGDEVFAGYNKHAAELRMRRGGILNALVRAGSPVWSALPKSRNNTLTNTFRQLDRFAKGSQIPPAERYWKWASFSDDTSTISLFHPSIKRKISSNYSTNLQKQFTSCISTKDFNEVLLADMNLVLLSDMLVKVDLMSMANSLEIRSPFLDQEVVQFAFGLPAAYKIDKDLKKKVVQDAFRSHLPPELYNRPKHGFEIPLLNWLRRDLWGLINDDLLDIEFIKKQEIFDVSFIENLKKKLHSSNPGDSHATIWALVVFQYWWKHYIET